MRIGDLNYLDKSNKLEDLNGTETAGRAAVSALSESEKKRKKWKNWWYYYKWYVICGILLVGIVINVVGSSLGLWTKSPDFQVAYIGKTALPQDTVSALEQAFASIASDFNGDGEIIMQINQYINGFRSTDPDMVSYAHASEITLIGDISDCDSYFFLMDDPDGFQRDFQLLASPDGSCPDDTDYSIKDKVIPWASCPLLSEMDLGSYSASLPGGILSGSNQELLSGLSVGRRCFFADKQTDNMESCNELWDRLCHAYQ